MSYIGNNLQVAFPSYTNIDDISGSFNGVLKTFALTVNGAAPVPLPINSQQCLISVNGVVQRPDDTGTEGFRLSGGNIIFSSAPSSGWDFFGIILAGADYVNVGVKYPVGSLAAPSITFDSDLDTGFYNYGPNQIGVSCGGVLSTVFTSSGYGFGAGTAAAPGLFVTGDTNTGFYSPGADQVAISTGGSGRLFVNSDGNISVGATTNDAVGSTSTITIDRAAGNGQLSVAANGTVRGRIFADNSTSELRIGNPTANALMLFTNNAERLRITAAGLVGVGTSSPTSLLHLTASGLADLRFTDTGEATDQKNWAWQTGTPVGAGIFRLRAINDANSSGENAYIITRSGASVQTHQWLTAGLARLHIDSSGRVGIGDSAPANKLQILEALAAIPSLGSGGHAVAVAGSTNYGLALGALTTGEGYLQAGRWSGTATAYNLLLQPKGGSVGIGTTSPVRLFHALDSANTIVGRIESGQSSGWLQFAASGNGTASRIGSPDGSSIANLAFMTNDIERARIDSSGRLLVGTSSLRQVWQINPTIQAESTVYTHLSLVANSTNAAISPVITLARTRGAAVGGTTAVLQDDSLGIIGFAGAQNSAIDSLAASISCAVDSQVGTAGDTSDVSGRLVFSTTLDGATGATEALRITNDQVVCYNQPAPTSKSAAATLTVAELKTGIIQYTGAAATLTLPTGTLTEGGFSGIYTNMTFEWSVINTGSGTCTIGAGTDHTIVGAATVAAGDSGRFASRRTAANTFVSYRLS